jgi:hexosaminidase
MALKQDFHRIVHLDLKGIPPTAKRLAQLPQIFASLGLTGILVEWEDTFPYLRFPEMKAEYTYSVSTVKEFLKQAQKAGLLVIPLIQTFGHLESLLVQKKHYGLRELPDDPRCVCPLKPESGVVVGRMVEDMIRLHGEFGLKYLHLGGDEVYGLGACPKCKKFVDKQGKDQLYLRHMNPLFEQVNAAGIRPMIWHDMMRGWSKEALKPLVGRVDVMFWNYCGEQHQVESFCSPRDMKLFRSLKIDCWGGAAYKGADGPDRNIPDLNCRGKNTLIWHDLAKKYKLEGVALTAWTRYNTLITCCEPMEASWDSLAICSRILKQGKFNLDPDLKLARKQLYGSTDPEKEGCRKNQILWDNYKAVQELETWVQGFETWHIKRGLWQCPAMWGESRFNIRESKDVIQAAEKMLGDFSKIAEKNRKASKGLVMDVEVERFLRSRLDPRKKVWRYIEKEMKRHL